MFITINRLSDVFVHNDYGYLSYPYNSTNGDRVVRWAWTLGTTAAAIHYGMRPDACLFVSSVLAVLNGGFAAFLATYPRMFLITVGTTSVVCASRLLVKSIEM